MTASLVDRVASIFSGWMGAPSRERFGSVTWRAFLKKKKKIGYRFIVTCCAASSCGLRPTVFVRVRIVSFASGAAAGLLIPEAKIGNLALQFVDLEVEGAEGWKQLQEVCDHYVSRAGKGAVIEELNTGKGIGGSE